jgi:hypothetical protein
MTAETVERTSCPQNPQRPRVLHACEVLATFLEMPAVDSSSLTIALVTAVFRTALFRSAGIFSARVASPATQLAPRCVRRVSETETEARWDATAGIIMVPRGDDDARTRCAARGARSETAAVTVLNAIVSVAM